MKPIEHRLDQLKQYADRMTKPEEQSDENFEKFTSLFRILPYLTPAQLSTLGFEGWIEARERTIP